MHNYENTEDTGLNAADFLGTYLKKEDLEEEVVVNLIAVRAEQMSNSARRKLVAQFAEFEKALVLNSTNIKRLANIFQSKNTANWRGAITLYVDETVSFGGNEVGGIRVKEATRNGGGVRSGHSEADFF